MAARNLMWFKEKKCKVLHQEKNTPITGVCWGQPAGKHLDRKWHGIPGRHQGEHEQAMYLSGIEDQ